MLYTVHCDVQSIALSNAKLIICDLLCTTSSVCYYVLVCILLCLL